MTVESLKAGKASVVDATTGATVASAQYPDTEAAIITPHPGWAEQDPRQWWDSLLAATQRLGRQLASTSASLADVSAIGISYQMHGLVCWWNTIWAGPSPASTAGTLPAMTTTAATAPSACPISAWPTCGRRG